MRIIFFGTPNFAAAHLQHLIDEGIEVVAVVTAADKPAGRGKKLSPSPVKTIALRHDLPLLQPINLKDPQFEQTLKAFRADLFIVIAFRMMPENIWRLPPLGTFNLHASLLPQYRGAAPINRAIMNGETKTGLTTFFINENIDTGYIIGQTEIEIKPNETAGELHERMIEKGKPLVMQTIHSIAAQTAKPLPQSDFDNHAIELKKAPKIFKHDGEIDWDLSGHQIVNQIRGLNPSPGAFTQLENAAGETMDLKIFLGYFESDPSEKDVLTLLTDNRSFLKVALKDGFLFLTKVQQSGKRPMTIAEFLNGNKFNSRWQVIKSSKTLSKD